MTSFVRYKDWLCVLYNLKLLHYEELWRKTLTIHHDKLPHKLLPIKFYFSIGEIVILCCCPFSSSITFFYLQLIAIDQEVRFQVLPVVLNKDDFSLQVILFPRQNASNIITERTIVFVESCKLWTIPRRWSLPVVNFQFLITCEDTTPSIPKHCCNVWECVALSERLSPRWVIRSSAFTRPLSWFLQHKIARRQSHFII